MRPYRYSPMAMRNGAGAAVFFSALCADAGNELVLEIEEVAQQFECLEDLTFCDELVDMLQGGLDALVAVTSQDERQGSAEEFPRIARISRRHQHDLDDEIELADGRNRLFRLHDMGFEQKVDVVEELERDLAVRLEHGAVDVDLFRSGFQADLQRFSHCMPSRMIWETSIRPSTLSERPWRTSSASRRSQRPIEMRLARSSLGSALSGLPRSSTKWVQTRLTNSRASTASRDWSPASRALASMSIERDSSCFSRSLASATESDWDLGVGRIGT